ncbi:type II secretory pathway, component PulF [Desulfitobacterium dichloroeliminans LMG P-21439]|uniref:Type II secretory pathway, component PulF n=1 Tax=Desulfitobacterium dichloroeliminans (strain LMG P-21439 / DCA1) TaxID=871963 RepID=L0F7Q8_DESDL|nr:type II secretion system F family protein [Desulfitobacterium dichloroeliminans]AGA69874.1 type II secretory pathway, component PulF [Desulfitobacterium dichloroeliminans LMG P-21439]
MRNYSFSWKALDQEGNTFEGIWDVKHDTEVRKRLYAKGYYPLAIVPRGRKLTLLMGYLNYLNVKSDKLRIWASITHRLALLLQAGIPLLLAIDILAKQHKTSRINRYGWDQVIEQLEAGAEFSDALEVMALPPTPYIKAMVQAGERAGKMPEALGTLSGELMEEHKYRSKLRGILAYPLLLLILTLGIIYTLSLMVLPVYERIFLSMGAELPMLTQIIFRVSHSLPALILLIGLGGILSFIVLRIRNQDYWQEKFRDKLCYIPLFGKVYQLNDHLKFSQVLGTLLEAGVPLLEALRLTRDTVQTFSMKNLVLELEEAARMGRRLAPVLLHTGGFPKDAAQMIEVGEESGQLSPMLHHLSKLFRMELEDQMNRVPNLIGPLLVMVLAGIIGLVAVGVLLPIFDLGTHIQ